MVLKLCSNPKKALAFLTHSKDKLHKKEPINIEAKERKAAKPANKKCICDFTVTIFNGQRS